MLEVRPELAGGIISPADDDEKEIFEPWLELCEGHWVVSLSALRKQKVCQHGNMNVGLRDGGQPGRRREVHLWFATCSDSAEHMGGF
ncbi:hypothetical protein JOQ06_008809 [Pogonophryne albipinna]|uniref:Uncharacterized protein n=1 Tax=Pogonophryne albipinna TaxID=1090488 RepID=A0AAD6BMZ9_9TELE|nr:hypothetical protein JOQ06_008809 [Pogonophryne albipinna]